MKTLAATQTKIFDIQLHSASSSYTNPLRGLHAGMKKGQGDVLMFCVTG